MQVPASLKSLPWRSVVGLLLAGLIGWLAAWYVVPGGPAPGAGVPPKESLPGAGRAAPAGQTLPAPAPSQGPVDTTPRQTLEQLLQKQDKVSDSAARSGAPVPMPSASGALGAAPRVGAASSTSAREAARAERMKAMRDLQTKALADIQSVAPGDTKGMIAAVERFEAQMRSAGAPPLIDMENLRKTLEGADRIQQLNRQLIAESDKGRNADIVKVKALSQEIQTLQRSMPRQLIRADVLQKQFGTP